jgi:hypothetical protein
MILSEIFRIFTNPQVFGLVLDIIGAGYFGTSLAFKGLEQIVNEAYGNGNGLSENLGISFYKQRIEARIGMVWLFGGFLLQSIGTIYSCLELPICIVVLTIFLGLVLERWRRVHCNDEEIIKKLHRKDSEMSNES